MFFIDGESLPSINGTGRGGLFFSARGVLAHIFRRMA